MIVSYKKFFRCTLAIRSDRMSFFFMHDVDSTRHYSLHPPSYWNAEVEAMDRWKKDWQLEREG